jgi:hypothetical protein
MKAMIRFRVGSTWLCVEDGKGRAPAHPDSVTVAVREGRADGRSGRRIASSPGTGRTELLALGLRLLELADRMTPETTWLDSVPAAGGDPAAGALNSGTADQELVERLSIDRPIDFAHHTHASAERLRERMPILRAAQCLLQNCDDETAANLYMLLSVADLYGCLPVGPALNTHKPGSVEQDNVCPGDFVTH